MSVNNFVLYGERHSGTTWISKVIGNVFNLPIISEKYDNKHFFGFCNWNDLRSANNTLFVCVVRNIYSWISGMQRIPYHLEHNDLFNIKPWKSILSVKEILTDRNWIDTKSSYDNIFDMRHHKILFQYCYLPFLVQNYIFIRYEDFILNYPSIIQQISKTYNLTINEDYPIYSDKSKLMIDVYKNTFDEINRSAFWLTEKMIGYKKLENYHHSMRCEDALDKPMVIV